MNTRRNIWRMLAGLVTATGVRAQKERAVKIVHRQELSGPFEGMDAAFVEVTMPPGPSAPEHRHSGFVLGYVLEGEFRFQIAGGQEKVLRPGETFYEPVGAVHTVSASASASKPAKILAIVIGEKGKPVTTSAR